MTKALKKNIRRSITDSLGRYIAILLIIMLGVAFFSGLKLTRPAMIATATDYLDETKLYDLRLLSMWRRCPNATVLLPPPAVSAGTFSGWTTLPSGC